MIHMHNFLDVLYMMLGQNTQHLNMIYKRPSQSYIVNKQRRFVIFNMDFISSLGIYKW